MIVTVTYYVIFSLLAAFIIIVQDRRDSKYDPLFLSDVLWAVFVGLIPMYNVVIVLSEIWHHSRKLSKWDSKIMDSRSRREYERRMKKAKDKNEL